MAECPLAPGWFFFCLTFDVMIFREQQGTTCTISSNAAFHIIEIDFTLGKLVCCIKQSINIYYISKQKVFYSKIH